MRMCSALLQVKWLSSQVMQQVLHLSLFVKRPSQTLLVLSKVWRGPITLVHMQPQKTLLCEGNHLFNDLLNSLIYLLSFSGRFSIPSLRPSFGLLTKFWCDFVYFNLAQKCHSQFFCLRCIGGHLSPSCFWTTQWPLHCLFSMPLIRSCTQSCISSRIFSLLLKKFGRVFVHSPRSGRPPARPVSNDYAVKIKCQMLTNRALLTVLLFQNCALLYKKMTGSNVVLLDRSGKTTDLVIVSLGTSVDGLDCAVLAEFDYVWMNRNISLTVEN